MVPIDLFAKKIIPIIVCTISEDHHEQNLRSIYSILFKAISIDSIENVIETRLFRVSPHEDLCLIVNFISSQIFPQILHYHLGAYLGPEASR